MKKITLLFLSLLSPLVAQMAPQPLPQVEHLQGQNYLFSWEGVPGRVYFIQTSSTLTTGDFDWEFAPDIRVGTGNQIEMGFQANAAHFEFFRLVYSDYSGGTDPDLADFDGDGFTNLEEAIANTDPYDAQSYPGSGGSPGGGNSSGNGTTWNHPWEYKLTYTVNGSSTEDLINPYNPVRKYEYYLESGYDTQIQFENITGDNSVRFLRVEPNLNYDSNDPSSKEWNILGEVEFSSQHLTWSHTGSGGTGTEGILLPFDLDVDADNTTVGNYPDLSNVDRGDNEEIAEDHQNEEIHPGVRIYANYLDFDGDGVPGYADGIELHGNGGGGACRNFEPILIDLGEISTILPDLEMVFKYSDSDPNMMVKNGDFYELPGGGKLRIWKKDGSESRNPNSIDIINGDFIKDDCPYDLSDLNLFDNDGVMRLFMEVVEEYAMHSSTRVTLDLYPQGFSKGDKVSMSFKVRPYRIPVENKD